MNEVNLNEEQLNKLINHLQGSCDNIDSYIEEEFDADSLSTENYATIDQAIFLCDECGWWCSQDENSEKVEEWVCEDCA